MNNHEVLTGSQSFPSYSAMIISQIMTPLKYVVALKLVNAAMLHIGVNLGEKMQPSIEWQQKKHV